METHGQAVSQELVDGAAPTPSVGGQAVHDQAQGGSHLLELWSDREEVHVLPEIIRPGEGLVAVGSGTVLRSGRLAQSRWLVVLTDQRLLCIKGRIAATRKLIEMPVSAIRSVSKQGIVKKLLVLDTGYGTLRVTSMKNSHATQIVDGLKALMQANEQGSGGGQVAAIPRADLGKLAGAAAGASADGIEAAVTRIRTDVSELRARVQQLEELMKGRAGES